MHPKQEIVAHNTAQRHAEATVPFQILMDEANAVSTGFWNPGPADVTPLL